MSFKVRGGGRRTSGANIESRRKTTMEKVNQGESQTAIAAELGVSRSTLWRDLESLRLKYSSEASAEFQEYRKKQLEILEQIEKAIVAGIILPDVANAWRQVRADISKLLGLDSPTKHLTAHVDAESSPLFLRMKKACAGLGEAQLEEVMRFAAALPRAASAAPKDASWFPKALPEEAQ